VAIGIPLIDQRVVTNAWLLYHFEDHEASAEWDEKVSRKVAKAHFISLLPLGAKQMMLKCNLSLFYPHM
jgi:hypothetical protein